MRKESILVVVVLLAGIVASTPPGNRVLHYAIAAGIFCIAPLAIIVFFGGQIPFHTNLTIIIPVGILWALFIIHVAFTPVAAGIRRLVVFLVITGVSLFIIPAAIDRATIQHVIALTATVLVATALPVLFIGPFSVGPLQFGAWMLDRSTWGLPPYNPTSVFRQPNTVAWFGALGAIAAIGEVHRAAKDGRRQWQWFATGMIILNMFACIATRARAALLAIGAAGILYLAYRFFGHQGLALATVSGAVLGLAGLFMLVDILPGLSVNLNSRGALWRASYRGFLDRPLWGWGVGNSNEAVKRYATNIPQNNPSASNSYIRMFLMAGVASGIAYLTLCVNALVLGFLSINTQTDLVGYLLIVAFLILQTFTGLTLFGLSLFSILGALIIGQAQSTTTIRTVRILPQWMFPQQLARPTE